MFLFPLSTAWCRGLFVRRRVQVEDLYYHKFTQGVLWPLFHSIPTNFNEALLENFQSQYEVRGTLVLLHGIYAGGYEPWLAGA